MTIWKIDDCENIYSVNPLHLINNDASGSKWKYLILDDCVNENKELQKKYTDVWVELKTNSKQ